MKNKKFYTAKNDHAFKEIFMKEENKDILIPLLEECLHVNIYDIIYLNVEDRVDYIDVRKKTYDLRLSTNIGIIQLEVNANIYLYSKNRQMAYISNEYSHYTLSGEEYDEDINIIQINFTYGLMKNFREENRNLYDDKPYRIYKVMDDDCKLYVNNFKIYDFNMDYFMKYWYNKDEEMINRYKLFIMMDLGIRELNNLVSISKDDKVVSKYMEEIDKISNEEDLLIDAFNDISRSICSIEGHRLSEKILLDETSHTNYRECLCCNSHIFADTVTEKDIVVKENSNTPVKKLIKNNTKK